MDRGWSVTEDTKAHETTTRMVRPYPPTEVHAGTDIGLESGRVVSRGL